MINYIRYKYSSKCIKDPLLIELVDRAIIFNGLTTNPYKTSSFVKRQITVNWGPARNTLWDVRKVKFDEVTVDNWLIKCSPRPTFINKIIYSPWCLRDFFKLYVTRARDTVTLNVVFLSYNNQLKDNFMVSAFSKRFNKRLLFIAQYFLSVIIKYANFCSKKNLFKILI